MSVTDTGGAPPPQASTGAEFMGHPRGLVTLFFTEMWERFSFYGMRALLVIYLTQHFLFSDDKAQGLYGAYAALVYLIPVIGGVIADRFLGARKAVTIGALFLVLGHFGMAFEGKGTVQEITIAGATYDVVAQGRGEARQLFLVNGEGEYPVTFSTEGMTVDPASGIANFTATADYALSTRPDVMSLGGLQIPYEQILYLSLAFIIIGVGFLKANISTTVGSLYAPGDPRRDGGFTIFYMGINLGAFLATLACGYLGQTYGWKYGFGLAGIGMLLGLIQYLLGQEHLLGKAEPPRPIGAAVEGAFWIGGLLAVIPAWMLVQQSSIMVEPIANLFGLSGLPAFLQAAMDELSLFQVVVLTLFFSMFGYAAAAFSGVERGKMMAALVLIVFSVVFWTLFEQAGSSLSLFAERSSNLTVASAGTAGHVFMTGLLGLVTVVAAGMVLGCFWWFSRKVIDIVLLLYGVVFFSALAVAAGYIAATTGLGGDAYQMTAAQTQSFNAGYIVLLALPLSAAWIWLAKRKIEPSTPVKFALGLIQVGLGFFVLVAGVQFAGDDFKVPLIFLALLYLFHTTGELFLSPVGLSMITKLSAARVVGLMMGVWFLSSSLAHILAAQIAKLTSSGTIAGQVVDPAAQLQSYVTVFTGVGIAGLAAGVVLLALSPFIKKWMADVH
jgi:proton-dependent oligopeptide transporter, POT family